MAARAIEDFKAVALEVDPSAATPELLSFSDIPSIEIEFLHPCAVVMVGRMKAGKSSFLNALLGEKGGGRDYRDDPFDQPLRPSPPSASPVSFPGACGQPGTPPR